MGIRRGMHLSPYEQLPAHFGRVGKWISGVEWWGEGKELCDFSSGVV